MERSPESAYGIGRWKLRIGLLLAATMLLTLAATIAGTRAAPAAAGCTIDGNAITTNLPQEQCDALWALYQTTGGDLHWTHKNGWDTHNSNPCDWYGVYCSNHASVVEALDLPGNGLDGWITGQIEDLTSLTYLDLSHNDLANFLPEGLGDLTALEHLDVSYNDLTGDITEAMNGLIVNGVLTELQLSDGTGHNGCFSTTSATLDEQIAALDGDWDECESSCTINGTKTRTAISQPECDALVALYQSTDGPNWTSFAGWNTPTDPCGWWGVTCSPTAVTGVSLYSNNLSGPVPPEIGGLTHMTEFSISDNHVTSLPDEIGGLASLANLYISANPITTLPAGIGNLSNLQELYAIQDHLRELPPEFGGLTSLVSFDMSGNYVTHLPVEFGNLASLKSAVIWSNRLTGDITAQMAGVMDTVTYLKIEDGPGFNTCLYVTNPTVESWLTAKAPDWDECTIEKRDVDVVVIGGPAAVSNAAVARLKTLTAGSVIRISGLNRYGTAAAISEWSFTPGVPAVYLATGLNYPDALTAGPAAGEEGAPILLVTKNTIPSETVKELARLHPGRIVVVGGTAVVSNAVVNAAKQYTNGTVERLAGPNRYATAAEVSASAFDPDVGTVIIATGENFPDALAGGTAGVTWNGPLLLTRRNALPAETVAELQRLHPQRIMIFGGTAVVSPAVENALAAYTTGAVRRYAGANRYATAARISAGAFPGGSGTVFIATGVNFPDAVAAGPVAGVAQAPILLVDGDATIPTPTVDEIDRLGG